MEYSGTYIVFGPPGTGKTTWLAAQVKACFEAGEKLLVTSLTRAAAREVASRKLPIPPESVGTLHSHAYRAIGRPKVVAGPELTDWNKTHPQYRMTGGDVDEEDPLGYVVRGRKQIGDELLEEVDVLRHRMVDPALWAARLRGFHRRWADWKEALGVIDFTDMIAMAYADAPHAPGGPTVILADEAQDLSRLEYSLLKGWSRWAKSLIIVGDPWQSLYVWRGADPTVFDDPEVPASHRKVLAQSWRVPAKVHRVARQWISSLSTFDPGVEYKPREEQGTYGSVCGSYKYPIPIIDLAEDKARGGASVMIQATAAYMLRPIVEELRNRALPFANPWRTKRGDWNPLTRRRGSVTTTDRVGIAFRAYLEAEADPFGASVAWTQQDLAYLIEMIDGPKCLNSGSKKAIREAAETAGDAPVTSAYLAQHCKPGTDTLHMLWGLCVGAAEPDVAADWLLQNTVASRRRPIAFPLQVVARRGADALVLPPRIYVGTVHSFKGGEADVAIVLPDTSWAANQEAQTQAGKDAVLRTFYVALTRAKHELYVTDRGGGTGVCLPAA